MSLSKAEKDALMRIKGMKELKALYEQQLKGSGLKGRGFWDDVKKAVGNVNDFLKKTKVISKASAFAAKVLPFTPYAEFTPVASGVSSVADSLGYGKKRVAIKKPMITMDGRFSTAVVPTHPAVVMKGKGRSVRQGVFNTVSSEYGKIKF